MVDNFCPDTICPAPGAFSLSYEKFFWHTSCNRIILSYGNKVWHGYCKGYILSYGNKVWHTSCKADFENENQYQ